MASGSGRRGEAGGRAGAAGDNPPALKMVIAVDFGTTYSGVAYANTLEPRNHKILTDWGPGFTGDKTPTVMKYDNGGTHGTFKWGFQATKNLRQGEKVHEWFKLGLCPEIQDRLAAEGEFLTNFPSKTALPPVQGADCESVVTAYLRSVKTAADNYFKKVFNEQVYKIPREYIITVPAMWTDRAQDATRRCAVSAGMGELQIIAEPEAAGIYALSEFAKFPGNVTAGDSFVICDAGGGTVDLASYTVVSLSPHLTLSSTAIGSGGLCGSSFLNRIFADYLQRNLHIQDTDRAKMAWLQSAVKEFETDIKPSFTGEEGNNHLYYIDAPGQRFQVDNNHSNGIRVMENEQPEVQIPAIVIKRDIFDPIISKIQGLVRDQIAVTPNVKAVLLVGGFGQSRYLEKRLKKAVPPGVKVCPHENSRTAIVRGALIAALSGQARSDWPGGQARTQTMPGGLQSDGGDGGINTRVISRLASKHYGVKAFEQYNPFVHTGGENRKVKRGVSGSDEIETIQWFTKREEIIRAGEPRKFPLFYDKEKSKGPPSQISCSIYACPSSIPPMYPPTDMQRNSAVPLLTLSIPLTRLPTNLPTEIRNGREFYIIDFEVLMSLHSASLSFVLARGDERYEPKFVQFL